jgi:hypothetical protein
MHVTSRIAAGLTLAGALGLGGAAAAANNFDVSNSGMSAYIVNGVNNPTLTLTRGQTYTFNVTASGHPFWITTARGAGDAEGNAFTQGVTGNGNSPGIVMFTVPTSPAGPATLFYQCNFHDPMGGTLNIVPAAVVASVPAGGTVALVGLAFLLLAGRFLLVRRGRFTK